jgi:hypothetical protein
MSDKVSKEAAKKMLELIREQEKKGRVVLLVLDGEVHSMNLDALLQQPAEGLLYDLNRDKVTCSVWIGEGKRTWVNNYAVALVIERLMEQNCALRESLQQTTQEDKAG